MGDIKKKRKDYADRSDIEKIESQWKKINGLYNRGDWSAAIVRAATACELAANFAIRREFAARSEGFNTHFIDSLLKWSNGLSGKIDKILTPMFYKAQHYNDLRALFPLGEEINKKRNEIAHRGVFCKSNESKDLIGKCRTFVMGMVTHYEDGFFLPELEGETE